MDTAAFCEKLVREQDPDRYFATLFAPAERRPGLFALYAFNSEIARVREAVSEPIPGEIRLAWWREVLQGQRPDEASAHPVAEAIRTTIAANRLPADAFVRMTEARVLDLYNDPIPSVNDLEGYTGDTSSALIRLASIILVGGGEPGGAEASGHAGVAYAITGLLRALPFHAERGQVFIPAEVLARHGARRDDILAGRSSHGVYAALREMRAMARHHLEAARRVSREIKPEASAAFLPVALCDLYLKRMEKSGYNPFRTLIEAPQWRRQAALWTAAKRGRPLG
ncbi:phytoene/squalene synthase family protein [Terrihabitans soli]|nr:phytoene/squalene synthase family protein [Terrihabitans soli]